MIIHQIKYTEHEGLPEEWQLATAQFESLTLLVGKNASGKSRTINVIAGLSRLVSGEQKPSFTSGNYSVIFKDDATNYEYLLHYEDSKVVKEEFSRDGTLLLERREGGVGRIYAEKSSNFVEFQTPESELACVNRRDSIQHPFFEVLHEWAQGVRHYKFGSSLGKDSYAIISNESKAKFNPQETEKVISIFKKGVKDFGDEYIQGIIQDMAKIGYDLESIGTRAPTTFIVDFPTPIELVGLYVKEKDLDGITEQANMSQGMFRALSIITQLNFSARSQEPSCILIDDIGEGLDFDRSCSLIKLIISKIRNKNTQLLMSTNDRFVMNSVPLEHWALIQRKKGTCQIFNRINSQDKFEAFKFTGLNNFDFFATNFIESDFNEEDGDIH